MKNKYLLACGIIASFLYIGSDIIAGLSWAGYSFSSQAVSELRGIGAPTRTFLVPILSAYAVFELAFGIGIWRIAVGKHALRITGALFIGLGVLDLMGPFFAMNAGEAVGSVTNIVHMLITMLTLIFILLILGFGSVTAGKRFRIYSILTLLAVMVGGTLTFMDVPRIAANLPTPLMGVKERINIYSYMVWIGILALTLLRRPSIKVMEQ